MSSAAPARCVVAEGWCDAHNQPAEDCAELEPRELEDDDDEAAP